MDKRIAALEEALVIWSNAFYDHDHEGCSWACIAAFNGKESNERTI